MTAPSQLRPPSATATRPTLPRPLPPPHPTSTAHTSSTAPGTSTAHSRPPKATATPAPRRVPATAATGAGGAGPLPQTARKTSGRSGLESGAAQPEGARTMRKPSRMLASGIGDGAASSTLTRSTTGLAPSSRSTAPPSSALSNSTSLRTFPSTATSQRTLSSAPSNAPAPETPRTRARSRSIASQALTRSLSRSSSNKQLARDKEVDSPQTARPRRTLRPVAEGEKGHGDGAAGRTKATLAGLGRPAPPPTDTSPTTARKASSTLRSTSSSATPSTAQKTPLRTSTRRPSGSGTSRPTEMKPPPPPSTAAASRTLHRRNPTAASAIPVSAAVAGGRLLKKASVLSNASTASSATSNATSEASSQHSAILRAGEVSALRRSRTEGRLGGPPPLAPPTAGKAPRSPGRARTSAAAASRIPPRPRGSSLAQQRKLDVEREDDPAASEMSRRESWVTEPGSARPSLSAVFEPLPFLAVSQAEDADRSWETLDSRRTSALPDSELPFPSVTDASSFATPRKPSGSAAPASASTVPSDFALPTRSALSYVSPDTSTSRFSSIYLSPSDSPPIRARLSLSPAPPPPAHSLSASSSAAGLASPVTPRPRQVSLLRTAAGRRKPRDSASLDELLRLGLQHGAEGAREFELLLDEDTSVLMREDLEAAGGIGAGVDGHTPWRGRVLSLSMSTGKGGSPMRRSMVVREENDENEDEVERAEQERTSDEEQREEEGEEEEQTQVLVLPLRPSTNEAVELRQQLETLQSELAQLRAASSDAEHVLQLEHALAAQRRHTDELEHAHAAEREAMEADLATLAAAASRAAAPTPAVALPAAVDHARLAAVELELAATHARGGCARTEQAYEGLEARAKAERDGVRCDLEALRALQVGLNGWAGLLAVC